MISELFAGQFATPLLAAALYASGLPAAAPMRGAAGDHIREAVIHGSVEAARGRIARSVVQLEIRGPNFASSGPSFCAGTVASPNRILTAAHCFDGLSATARAYAVRIAGRGGDLPKAGFVAISPRYSGGKASGQNHDLAVIGFDTRLPLPLAPMRLAPADVGLTEGQKVYFAGFGSSNPSEPHVRGRLTSGAAVVFSAGSALILKADPSYLATGDSGGPSYLLAADGEPLLIGVNSGLYPAPMFSADIFSNIAELRPDRDWLTNCLRPVSGSCAD